MTFVVRAVLYARCSTEEESQKDALINQVAEGEACIRQKGWLLVDKYVESRSGTSTKKRDEYNRLFADMAVDKFDVIVIKSQDRLMRNTKDWYLFVDRLTTERKKLYMYIDSKFYTTDDSLITGIKAILAEDYSRELSKKINNAHKNRQLHSGNVIMTSNTYGFKKLPDKTVVIVEEEAAVKRRMYELSAAGYGARSIAIALKNEGIVNKKGKPFSDASIRRIIRSPLNKGTAVMHKTHYDFEAKKTFKIPEEEWIIHKNAVPAIVSEELWEMANRQMSAHQKVNPQITGEKTAKYHLSGKLFCGFCKSPYYRRSRKRYCDGKRIYEWSCKTYIEVGRNARWNARPQLRKIELENVHGCDNVHLDEKKLEQLLERVCEDNYQTDKGKVVDHMLFLLKKVLKEQDFEPEIKKQQSEKEKIREQTNLLLDKLLDGVISDAAYQVKQKQLEDKAANVQEKIQALERKKAQGAVLKERMNSIEKRLREGTAVQEATVESMLEEMDRIFIYPEHLEIHFAFAKSLGMEMNDSLDDVSVVRIDFGNLFDYRAQQKEGRELVVELMRENPAVTAKMIAKKLGLSLSGANCRIRILKNAGRIRFNGRGGHGTWEILEPEKTVNEKKGLGKR